MIDFQGIANEALYDLASLSETTTVIGVVQAATPNYADSLGLLADRFKTAVANGADVDAAVAAAEAAAVVASDGFVARIDDMVMLRDNLELRALVDASSFPSREHYDSCVVDGLVDGKEFSDEWVWCLAGLQDWVDHVAALDFSGVAIAIA